MGYSGKQLGTRNWLFEEALGRCICLVGEVEGSHLFCQLNERLFMASSFSVDVYESHGNSRRTACRLPLPVSYDSTESD